MCMKRREQAHILYFILHVICTGVLQRMCSLSLLFLVCWDYQSKGQGYHINLSLSIDKATGPSVTCALVWFKGERTFPLLRTVYNPGDILKNQLAYKSLTASGLPSNVLDETNLHILNKQWAFCLKNMGLFKDFKRSWLFATGLT